MTTTIDPHSPILQAEQARQVVGVLTWIERRYEAGAWARGTRFGRSGNCLIGGIDEATQWTMDGVSEDVVHQLARRLPAPLRPLGRIRPRLALALYNDLVGGRKGALELVRRTRHDLGGVGPVRPAPTTAPKRRQPADPASPGTIIAARVPAGDGR